MPSQTELESHWLFKSLCIRGEKKLFYGSLKINFFLIKLSFFKLQNDSVKLH